MERITQDLIGIGDSATVTLQEGTTNGEVEVTVDKEGAIGNDYAIKVIDPEENTNSLSASLSGWTITVELATDGSGVILEDGSNDATAVASAIDGITEFSASASGDGSAHVGVISLTEFSGGADDWLLEGNIEEVVPDDETWIIEKIILCNVTSSAQFVSLSIINPEQGVVDYHNRILEEYDISANDILEIDGPIVMMSGDTLYGIAESLNAISVNIGVTKKTTINHYNS